MRILSTSTRLIGITWWFLSLVSALACRYNVRDLGFIDSGSDPYRLYVLLRSDTSPGEETRLSESAKSILLDSNVQAEMVGKEAPADHPAYQLVIQRSPTNLPVAVLVSPDGQSLPLALRQSGKSVQEAWSGVTAECVTSPVRQVILEKVVQVFGVILLIEGETQKENQQAREAIREAIEEIRLQLQLLPKPIAQPPALVSIPHARQASERVLLWSLGLDSIPQSETRVAVVYGRARWIGPLMKGPEISTANLVRLFSVIGADCECGLDLAWTRGTPLPIKWTEARHAETAKRLGFDPENPLVKVEAGRILDRYSNSAKTPSLGYQELDLDSKLSKTNLLAAAGRGSNQAPAQVEPVPASRAAPGPVKEGQVFGSSLIMGTVLAVLILAAGFWTLWKPSTKR